MSELQGREGRSPRSLDAIITVLTTGASVFATGAGISISSRALGTVLMALGGLMMAAATLSLLLGSRGLPGGPAAIGRWASRRGIVTSHLPGPSTQVGTAEGLAVCPSCGAGNASGDKFCFDCGGLLPAVGALPAQPPPSTVGPDRHRVLRGSLPDHPLHRPPPSAATPASVRAALGRAVGITFGLLLVVVAQVMFVGWSSKISPEATETWGAALVLFSWFATWFGIAAWIGRQAGWGWAAFTFLALPFALPTYVYRQSRGLIGGTSGRRAAAFPFLRLGAGLLVIGLVLIGGTWLVAG